MRILNLAARFRSWLPRTAAVLCLALIADWTLLVSAGFARAAGPAAASADAADAAKPKSLDDELLQGLTNELLEGLDSEPAPHVTSEPPANRDPALEKKAAPAQPTEAAQDPLDKELLDDLMPGEDIGASGEPDALTQISRDMRQVERLLARDKSDRTTQELQTKIVVELAKIIEQAKARRQQSSQSSDGQKQSRIARGQVKQPGRSSPRSPGAPSDKPASDSSNELRKDKTDKPDMDEMNRIAKALWGQLPGRAGEEMRNASIEQFLPKYDLLIEKYYRRLVEETGPANDEP